ncbi:hypothetical protein BH10PSE14_BH10PSE14_04070 [soil metagenome]
MLSEGSIPSSGLGGNIALVTHPSSLTTRVHPNFVLRVASEPAGVLGLLSTGSAAAAAARTRATETALKKRIEPLCERLFELCHDDAIDKVRAGVLQLKRDLFNMRPVPQGRAREILGAVDADLAAQIDAILLECDTVRADRDGLAAIYEEEIRGGREALLQRLDADCIGVALQQANRQLYADLMRLRVEGPLAFKPKDVDQLFLALQNYVLRAALKTSPKSTLTMFAAGDWTSQAARTPLAFDFHALAFQRMPRLNEAVLAKLLETLLRDRAAWADHAVFELNGTVETSGDRICWRNLLIETDLSGVSIGTQESRMELRRTRPIDLLLHQVHLLGADAFAIGALAEALRACTPEPFRPVIEQLVADAVAKGLIGPKMRIGSQTDRLTCAKGLLAELTPETVGRLAPAITAVETELTRYAAARAVDQASAHGNLEISFARLESSIGADPQAASTDPLIQEDSRIDLPPLSLDVRHVEDIEDDLGLLIRAAPLYTSGWGGVRYWMADRFIATFGRSGVCTDIVGFLTPLFDEIMVAVSEPRSVATPPGAQPLFNHSLAHELRERSQLFLATLDDQREDNRTLDIDRHWLARQIDALPEVIRNERRSHCINGQFLRNAADQHFVVNAIYPGNGRMISRFLGDDPSSVSKVREYLRDISLAGRYLAVPGVFGMNANFHPQHAAGELYLPPFPSDYEQAATTAIDTLNLRYDETRHNIFVCDADADPIDCFYFGILFSYRLPKIHFLIDALSGFSEAPPPIGRVLAGRQQKREQITRAPRITIGSIVAARASWSAPCDQLPRADVPPAEFFYRLLEWRDRHDLPREVYFSSTQLRSTDGEGASTMFKWRKPMFLDFQNPMTVRVLQRLLRKSRAAVFFTEALPARDDTIVRSANAGHVSEMSFELSLVPRQRHHAAVH